MTDEIQRRMDMVKPEEVDGHEYWFPEEFKRGNKFILRFSKDDIVREVACTAGNGLCHDHWLDPDESEIVDNRCIELEEEGADILKKVAAINQRDVRYEMGIYMHACMDTIFKGYELEIVNKNEEDLR